MPCIGQFPFILQTTRAETKKNQLQNYKFKLKNHVQNYKIVNLSMKELLNGANVPNIPSPKFQISPATLLQNMLPQLIPIDKSFLSRGHPQTEPQWKLPTELNINFV